MRGEFQYSSPRRYIISTKKEILHQDSSYNINCPSVDSNEVVDGDYVGYANLPQQLYRRAVRRGFEFTLMVVGESGLGKSTFINNLFLSDVYGADYSGPSHRIKKTIGVEQTNVHLVENGIHLYLNVIDVPGFGDFLNNNGCWMPIVKLVKDRHQQYLEQQMRSDRSFIVDTRVHCCLYFISPWGNGLNTLDIQAMKSLHEIVNIVPVIAKADAFTPEECVRFKEAVRRQIQENGIMVCDFPEYGTGDEISNQKEMLPFAIMGSQSLLESEEREGRGRRYPWGNAQVENAEHCDFIAVRNLLVRTHMHFLKESTERVFEAYRSRVLSCQGTSHHRTKLEGEKRVHERKLKQLAEELENVFDRKIAEKLQKLKDTEDELEYRSQQMSDALKRQWQKLKEERAAFERDKIDLDSESGEVQL